MNKKTKHVSFPKIMHSIKCPKCKGYVQGMLLVGEESKQKKYLLPCQHRISAEQEMVIVTDMYRQGL